MNYPKAIAAVYHKSHGDGFLRNAFKTTRYYFGGRAIIAHFKARIRGLKNITIAKDKTFVVGLLPNDLGVPSDVTSLKVSGQLNISGHFSIGRGTRISIGEKAIVNFASGFLNNNCLIAIEHSLNIGSDCAIGWNVHIIDSDYHSLIIDQGSPTVNDGVTIGDHVWIGSNVNILKNVKIADGCVVASGSLVNKKFEEPNCLIGGHPAKVLRRNIHWQ